MRSSGGTKSLLDWSVVACTKSRIACFAGPSFHEGSGSAGNCPCGGGPTGNCACAAVVRRSPDSTGSVASVESKKRRLMPEKADTDLMLLHSLMLSYSLPPKKIPQLFCLEACAFDDFLPH